MDVDDSNPKIFLLFCEIDNIQRNDSGLYKCLVNIPGAEAVCSFDFTFNQEEPGLAEKKKNASSPASFNEKPKDQVGIDGDRITVTCKVAGNPKPEIKWFKNKQPILNQKVSLKF